MAATRESDLALTALSSLSADSARSERLALQRVRYSSFVPQDQGKGGGLERLSSFFDSLKLSAGAKPGEPESMAGRLRSAASMPRETPPRDAARAGRLRRTTSLPGAESSDRFAATLGTLMFSLHAAKSGKKLTLRDLRMELLAAGCHVKTAKIGNRLADGRGEVNAKPYFVRMEILEHGPHHRVRFYDPSTINRGPGAGGAISTAEAAVIEQRFRALPAFKTVSRTAGGIT